MLRLRQYFLTGLLAVAPLLVTLWILWRLYLLVDGTVRPWVERIPGLHDVQIPSVVLTLVGAGAFLLVITLIGLFTRNLVGVAFFRFVERSLIRIPIIKGIFSATKQISEVFLQDQRTAFKKVVMFEYPRAGIFSLGFVTHENPELDFVNVFLPTTPNPTSGYMLLLPRGDVQVLPITVEEGIRLIISGGSVMTDGLGRAVQQIMPGHILPGRSVEDAAALTESKECP
jgi:uncharacterized membrane protein